MDTLYKICRIDEDVPYTWLISQKSFFVGNDI